MNAAEEARAAQYCRDQAARIAAQAARSRQLAGSTAAYVALVANWAPWISSENEDCNGGEEPRDSDQHNG
jgi:hypothetical protein